MTPSQGVPEFRALFADARSVLNAWCRGDPETRALVEGAARNERTRTFARLRSPHQQLLIQDALHIAAWQRGSDTYADLIYPLVNRDAVFVEPGHPLIRAVADNRPEEVEKLLSADPNVANARLRGETLDGKARDGYELVRVGGGEIRSTTPLHFACWHPELEAIVARFIAAGADVNALGYEGNCCGTTCLEPACWEGTTHSVEMLLAAGADPNLCQPLHQILEH